MHFRQNNYIAPNIINGSFGNNLFRLATALWFVETRKYKLVLSSEFNNTLDVFEYPYHQFINDDLYNKLKNDCVYTEKSFTYDSNVRELVGDIFLNGYFQSDKYFKEIKTDLKLYYFHPHSKNIAYYINKFVNRQDCDSLRYHLIGMHIRRGDYLSLQHRHPILNMDYYKKGFDLLYKDITRWSSSFIFTNDKEWCKNNFKEHVVLDLGTQNNIHDGRITDSWDWKNAIDLFLMTQCDSLIIANSSYSWWASFLSRKSPNLRTVAPQNWFGPAAPYSTQDLYLDNWIIL